MIQSGWGNKDTIVVINETCIAALIRFTLVCQKRRAVCNDHLFGVALTADFFTQKLFWQWAYFPSSLFTSLNKFCSTRLDKISIAT